MHGPHPPESKDGRLPLAALRAAWAAGRLGAKARAALADDARAGAQALLRQITRADAALAAERRRLGKMLRYERDLWRRGHRFVAGVDEVGVGPLAGPVVAAAVVFAPESLPFLHGLDDSKKVPTARRAALVAQIRACALAIGIGEATSLEVDGLNIFAATRLAAQRAVASLGQLPDHLLLDAHPLPAVPCPQTALVHGDGLSQSIAAASLVAKVHRDAWMAHLDELHPGYGFAEHVGYGTAGHLRALHARGPSPAHRRSFGPVRQAMGEASPAALHGA